MAPRRSDASREQSARHRALLAGMLDPVVTIDAAGIIQDASDSVRQASSATSPASWSAEHQAPDAGAAPLGARRLPGSATGARARPRSSAARGSSRSCARTDARSSASSRSRAIDIPGKGPLFIGSFRDVTADASAPSGRCARASAASAPSSTRSSSSSGLLSPDGTLLEVNQAALEAVGVARDEVVGKPFWETPWWSHSPEERERRPARPCRRGRDAASFVRFETTHALDRARRSRPSTSR